MKGKCVCPFCEILARRSPANIRYEDEQVIVIDNILKWVPVMPQSHVTQSQLWGSDLMATVGRVAVDMGERSCPGGYRLLSNFGDDAMQSQEHGHLHVLGGTFLGQYA